MAKIEEALELIKGMTLLELRDLNKAIEEEFGITAAAPMVMAAGGAAAGGGAPAAAAEEEKTEFNVVLKSFGDNKINVIKAVREVVSGHGLNEAKDLVEAAPAKVKEGIGKEEAETIKAKLSEAGATLDIEWASSCARGRASETAPPQGGPSLCGGVT
jgi:large subunit ribosomal protein L7/L12